MGEFGLDHQPTNPRYKTIQIRAPQAMVCRFERLLEANLARHAGGKYFGPNGFYYIDETAAGNILNDAIKQYLEGSADRDKLEAIRATLDSGSSGRSIWKIAPGQNADMWLQCREKGAIAIGWEIAGDIRQYKTEEEVKKALSDNKKNPIQDAKTTWRFVHEVCPGDIVVANRGRTAVVGVGVITGDYIPPDDPQNPNLPLPNARPVDWKITESVDLPFRLAIPTVVPVTRYQWQQIKEAYLQQNPSLQKVFDEMEGQNGKVSIIDPALKEVLQKTRNVILYGPPGTGKTYLARTFAEAWIKGQVSKTETSHRNYWYVVASPGKQDWHWDILFGKKETQRFHGGSIKRNYKDVRPGDLIFGYLARPNKQIYCLAEAVPLPANATGEWEFYMRGLKKLTTPLPWQRFRDDPILQNSEALRGNMRGTLFRLEPHEAERLRDLIEEDNPDLADIFDKYWSTRTGDYVRTVTFHQSYGYEDFIEGLRPAPSKQGQIQFEWRPGIFKKMCDDAAADPDNDFILIIDEINRGNMAKIFGELLTLLEDDKRAGQKNEMTVTLPGSQQRFGVPDNLYVLGTMNTADRSIALLDVALRRRFTFVEVTPDPALLAGQQIEGVPLDVLLSRLNSRIEALLDRDHCLGHSYFIGINSLDRLHFVWYRKIIPLLEEYFYNDGERLRAVLDNFVEFQNSASGIFANPPDTFDPGLLRYHIMPLSGTQFVAELKRIAGLV